MCVEVWRRAKGGGGVALTGVLGIAIRVMSDSLSHIHSIYLQLWAARMSIPGEGG
jgi:hypothetical protein